MVQLLRRELGSGVICSFSLAHRLQHADEMLFTGQSEGEMLILPFTYRTPLIKAKSVEVAGVRFKHLCVIVSVRVNTTGLSFVSALPSCDISHHLVQILSNSLVRVKARTVERFSDCKVSFCFLEIIK